jgi:hypothetical protein
MQAMLSFILFGAQAFVLKKPTSLPTSIPTSYPTNVPTSYPTSDSSSTPTSITTSIPIFVPIQNADFEADSAVVGSGQYVYMNPTGWQIASQGPIGIGGSYGVVVISCSSAAWGSDGCYDNKGLYFVGLQLAGTYISQYIYAIPNSISFVARLRANYQNGNAVGISVYIGNTLLNLFVVSSITWTTFTVVVTNNYRNH